VQVGDEVWAVPDDAPHTAGRWQKVEKTFQNAPAALLSVHVAGLAQPIRATHHHPWYVANQGWTPTADLQPGDHLLSHDGRTAQVTDLFDNGETEPVYNLCVEDDHTYFVGDEASAVLVHNFSVKEQRLRHLWQQIVENPTNISPEVIRQLKALGGLIDIDPKTGYGISSSYTYVPFIAENGQTKYFVLARTYDPAIFPKWLGGKTTHYWEVVDVQDVFNIDYKAAHDAYNRNREVVRAKVSNVSFGAMATLVAAPYAAAKAIAAAPAAGVYYYNAATAVSEAYTHTRAAQLYTAVAAGQMLGGKEPQQALEDSLVVLAPRMLLDEFGFPSFRALVPVPSPKNANPKQPNLNSNDAVSDFGIYEVEVNGTLNKVGKADLNRVTQSSGLPTRLHQQVRKLEKQHGIGNVRGEVVEELGSTTTRAAKAAETARLQRIYDKTGAVPKGNEKSFKPKKD
jgi:hypothetical protein